LIEYLCQKRYKIPLILIRIFKIRYVNFDTTEKSQTELLKLKESNLAFLSGWYFRIPISKHKEFLQDKYSLKPRYLKGNKIVDELNSLKNKGYKLVGIHVRRGDYATFEGGKYYYPWEFYHEKTNEIKSLLLDDKAIKFIFFSNEKAPDFMRREDVIISKEPWFIDHHLMTMCDYLLGPPSTFTIWASFMAGVKLCLIDKLDKRIQLSDFKVFENPLHE
jgi:hypothetical protein